jgi:hypothetical protein
MRLTAQIKEAFLSFICLTAKFFLALQAGKRCFSLFRLFLKPAGIK